MKPLATGYTLIEGPVWDPNRGLIFSDVHDGGVYCLGHDGTTSTVFEHRKGVGGMALHEHGGLVVSGRNIAYKGPATQGTHAFLSKEDVGAVGFNDLTTDSEGRIYAGSLARSPFAAEEEGETPTGGLFRIDLNGQTQQVSDGVVLTNGLGFSPDGETLYHCDSRQRHVRAYSVGESEDPILPWSVFATVDSGGPDGLAVAYDGSVWVAVAGGGCVIGFNPDGTERQRVPVPLPMVTSVCFGGEDLEDLFVVTGSVGASNDHSGSIYRAQVGVKGLPLAPARLQLTT